MKILVALKNENLKEEITIESYDRKSSQNVLREL